MMLVVRIVAHIAAFSKTNDAPQKSQGAGTASFNFLFVSIRGASETCVSRPSYFPGFPAGSKVFSTFLPFLGPSIS